MRTPRSIIAGLDERLTKLRKRLVAMVDRYYHGVPDRAPEPYATHLPVLICMARLGRVRRVLELGSGLHSTLMFLDRAAFPDLEYLRSLETVDAWADRVREAAAGDSRLELTVVPSTVAGAVATLPVDDYDLIFVDDSATVADRSATLSALARRRPRNAVVIVHDFENPAYRAASRRFAHRYRFVSINPNVGVLSNRPLDRAALAKLEKVVTGARDRVVTSARHEWCALMDREFARHS